MSEQYLKFTYLTMTAHPVFLVELVLAIIIILAGLFFFRKPQPAQVTSAIPQQKPATLKKSPIIITSQDIKAIAGEDIITTQLDLARAYMEIGKKKLARKILAHVTQHGTSSQQQAAQHLMANF